MSDNLENGRVIVTYGRSLMALTVAHSLAERGVEVIGCDDIDFTVLSFSRNVKKHFVHPSPEKDLEAYLAEMEKRVRKYKPDDGRPYVLMPIFCDTRIIAEHRDRFEGLCTVAAPPFAAIDKVDPKDRLAETAQDMGVHVPPTVHFHDADELAEAAKTVGFPALIKPRDGVGGRGIKKFDSEAPLLAFWKENSDRYRGGALLQKAVDGEDYCLTALFEKGQLKAHMAYRNLRQFPATTGAGVVRETVPDEAFAEIAQALLGPLEWNGVAELDFRWNGKDSEKPWLIEVNPRFWAGLFHSVESGIDFPWLNYELAVTGHAPEVAPAEIGSRSKVPAVWLVSAIEDIARSDVHFSQVETAFKEALTSMKDRNLLEGLKSAGSALGKVFNANDAAHRLKVARRQAMGADSEVVLREDPMISLGALFVLGSLLRHGKLPPELMR